MKQNKQTAFQATIELMKQKIIGGEWAPGDRLPTLQQLAVDFSVSVTTVREALRILESQGNVSIEHGRGMYVRNDPLLLDDPAAGLEELDNISIVDLLEARLLIEPELAALARSGPMRIRSAGCGYWQIVWCSKWRKAAPSSRPTSPFIS